MRDIFSLEPNTDIAPKDSYIVSYPHLLGYFASKKSFTTEDVVCGAHMAYGWMPTILDLYPESTKFSFIEAAELLTKAKATGTLKSSELEGLAGLINNSFVGASKLLHFIAPNNFEIFDSKVYAFVFNEKPWNHRVNKVENYEKYLIELNKLQKDSRFCQFHLSVNRKVGYSVSPLRAAELIMYLNSPTLK